MTDENTECETNNSYALSTRASGTLRQMGTSLTIGALEQALLAQFPAADAEEWDRTGLLIGDPAETIEKVAIALDPTPTAIAQASSLGANVVLTHHPAYLSAPEIFRPSSSVAENDGALVWAAISAHVAVMSFHTALDVSEVAARMLPGLLSLTYTERLVCPLATYSKKGYGQICIPHATDTPFSLAHLAARATSVFGRAPRTWGDFTRELKTIVTCTGSAGKVARASLSAGADCLVCGEIKYHDALALSQAGLCIVDLGHDVSELPFTSILANECMRAGVDADSIEILDQSDNWTYPETVRM